MITLFTFYQCDKEYTLCEKQTNVYIHVCVMCTIKILALVHGPKELNVKTAHDTSNYKCITTVSKPLGSVTCPYVCIDTCNIDN